MDEDGGTSGAKMQMDKAGWQTAGQVRGGMGRRAGGRHGRAKTRSRGGNQMPGGSGQGSIGGVGGFVPGVRLAGEFFAEVVRPLLEAEFPGLGYAAALIGAGSEVLGFDSERSADHDWGPRLLMFLEDDEADRL